jgi:flagellar hook assembly protein FlgD
LPDNEFVKITVYDAAGKLITALVEKVMQAGYYELEWNAENFPSGVYYYNISAGDYTETKKMVLIK